MASEMPYAVGLCPKHPEEFYVPLGSDADLLEWCPACEARLVVYRVHPPGVSEEAEIFRRALGRIAEGGYPAGTNVAEYARKVRARLACRGGDRGDQRRVVAGASRSAGALVIQSLSRGRDRI